MHTYVYTYVMSRTLSCPTRLSRISQASRYLSPIFVTIPVPYLSLSPVYLSLGYAFTSSRARVPVSVYLSTSLCPSVCLSISWRKPSARMHAPAAMRCCAAAVVLGP